MKIGRGVSELWGVENRPLPLTWPMAYTTACTTVQAVINNSTDVKSVVPAEQLEYVPCHWLPTHVSFHVTSLPVQPTVIVSSSRRFHVRPSFAIGGSAQPITAFRHTIQQHALIDLLLRITSFRSAVTTACARVQCLLSRDGAESLLQVVSSQINLKVQRFTRGV